MSSTAPAPFLSKNSRLPKKSLTFRLIIFTIAAIVAIYGWFLLKNLSVGNTVHNSTNQEDGELFDLNSNQNDEINIDEMKAQDLNEKGSDFIYQLLIKNQTQLDELKSDLRVLQSDFSKYKNQDKISKIVLNYVEFRNKFLSKTDFKKELQNLELLGSGDEFLSKTFEDLKNLAPEFLTNDELFAEFSKLVPELIANKSQNNQAAEGRNLLQNFRYYVAKLITVRKLNSKNPRELDAVIVAVEENIRSHNYQGALNSITLLDQKYFVLLGDFVEKLNVAIEVKKADENILNYLKNLS